MEDHGHKHLNPAQTGEAVVALVRSLSQAIACPADALRIVLMAATEIGDFLGVPDTEVIQLLGEIVRGKREADRLIDLLKGLTQAQRKGVDDVAKA